MIIEFYILNASNSQQAWLFACEHIEKRFQEKRHTYIHTESSSDAKRLDQLLWTFRDDSFLPHLCYEPSKPQSSPILIGYDDHTPEMTRDVLINLSNRIPPRFHEYQHLIEIVYNDADIQASARVRYKAYRDQQFQITTIKQ